LRHLPDAFTDFKADVRYTYSRAGVEQDIILREQPPSPASFGLSPQTTRLQVWTEFYDPPAPQITADPTNDDVSLRFGGMSTGRGKAFFIGDSTNAISVRKTWVTALGRTFLVEQVPFHAIAARVQTLPAPGTASINIPAQKPRLRQLPDQLPDAPLLARHEGEQLRLAEANPPKETGLVMDYLLVDWWAYGNLITYQDYDFAANTTYLITGPVYITGTTTIEPGAIIKFTDASSPDDPAGGLNVEYLACPTGAQPMAILTSVDDNSVGEPIGSGSPVTGTYNFYLRDGGDPNNVLDIAVSNLKVSYAANGVQSGSVVDSEFYHCARAVITTQNSGNWMANDLFSACDAPVSGGGGVEVQQVTCDAPHFTDGTIYASIVNSLFTGDFNGVESLSSYDSATMNLSPAIFQSANGDNYYLANGSGYRNTGSTAIDWSTAQDIAQRTTYPPPQNHAQWDADTPDLGYHYLPIQFNAWLAIYFGPNYASDPNAAPTADPDGDGVDNWHEYLAGSAPVNVSFGISTPSQFVSASPASIQLANIIGAPDQESVLVDPTHLTRTSPTDQTDFDTASWGSYNASPSVSLGTQQGRHDVWIGLRRSSDSQVDWEHVTLYYDHTSPVIAINKPATSGSISLLEIEGTSSEPLASLTYDLVNSSGTVTGQPADTVNSDFDTTAWDFTTTKFQCLDVEVVAGLNTFTFHAVDRAGNQTSQTFSHTLSDSGVAPTITADFPPANAVLGANGTFSATGTLAAGALGDPSAQITMTITDNQGNASSYSGEVERDGQYWFDDVPLPPGQSTMSFSAVNSWGNSTTTDPVSITQGNIHFPGIWTVDPFNPSLTVWAEVDYPSLTSPSTARRPAMTRTQADGK